MVSVWVCIKMRVLVCVGMNMCGCVRVCTQPQSLPLLPWAALSISLSLPLSLNFSTSLSFSVTLCLALSLPLSLALSPSDLWQHNIQSVIVVIRIHYTRIQPVAEVTASERQKVCVQVCERYSECVSE